MGPMISYVQNFLFANFCCVHPSYLKKAYAQGCRHTEKVELTFCHLYLSQDCCETFFEYCHSIQVHTEIWDMFRAVVGVIRFNWECYKYVEKQGLFKRNVLEQVLPHVCRHLKPLSCTETHPVGEEMASTALRYLKLFKNRIIQIPAWCKRKDINIDFKAYIKIFETIARNWNMPNETFIECHLSDYFFILSPLLGVCIKRIQQILRKFCKSTLAPRVLFRMSACFDDPTIRYILPSFSFSRQAKRKS